MRRIYVGALVLLLGSLTVLGQSLSRTDQKKEKEAERARLQNKSLLPSQEERVKYASVLKSKNTGLIRLLPREKYDMPELQRKDREPVAPETFRRKTFDEIHDRSVLSSISDDVPSIRTASPPARSPVVGKKSSDVRGGGAYYSFTQRTHDYGYATDLSLERGQFEVGFYGANYGFMSDLGDVPLESIDIDTPAAKPLFTYKPAKYDADARRESRSFSKGMEIDGIWVKRRLPMRLNSTYLLRAVNYAESDVLVAFKVVGIDSDGSPLILWKRLKRYSTPRLFRN